MSKYRCEECGHGCYVDTLEPGLPSKCVFDYRRKPDWVLIVDTTIPSWCEQDVAFYDNYRKAYGVISDIAGDVVYVTYQGIEGTFDSSPDYIVKYCTRALPDWVQARSWVYDTNERAYAYVVRTESSYVFLNYNTPDMADSYTRKTAKYVNDCMVKATCVTYTEKQMIELVGKVLYRKFNDGEINYRLVTCCTNHVHEDDSSAFCVKMGDDYFDASDLIWYYCDGKPCCTLLHEVEIDAE